MPAAALVCLVAEIASAPGTRYATTPAVEPDRCATAWVIQRYVDPRASFEFHPEGELPPGTTAFDLPDSELRRDARRAALEVLVEREHLTDPFVLYLARMVHDIEIASWARKSDAPSIGFEKRLMTPALAAPDPVTALAACFEVLDQMHREGALP